MYLKRLEIHGFKSFAPPTTLEFATGVTCVAGPNGAGKTNVAEAIRWVLGEQASRILRARKTEDVIFSGSAKRSAMGMAEVKITLDNSDGWLPLDFEEVVVSRRAYRSGDNEYYINQARVRLKDVTELFLKAQVGQNSYAFMGQGLVEQVLTLRPEERRGLIEEAADVRLFRDKLDESRNRLAATRDNLDRVAMLVKEIEPRLRQLERQAERANVHAELSAELAQTLRALFGQQWQDAQEAIAAARAACDQRKEEFESARRQVAACEEGLTALAAAIEEGRRDITQREETYRSLEDYRRDLEHRIAVDTERQSMLRTQRDALSVEIDALQRERAEQLDLTRRLAERAATLAQEQAAVRSPTEAAKELKRLDSHLSDLRAVLASIEREAAKATAQLAEIEGRSAALVEQRERLDEELALIQQVRKEQIALLKAWAQEFASRRQRAGYLMPAVQRLTRESGDAQARLDKHSADATRLEQDTHSLQLEMQSAQARLEAAQSTDIELPAQDAGVHAVLAAGGLVPGEEPDDDHRIHGLAGMVGQLLRVPAGFERAIEAALADSLHAVVVETQEDALAAIELLLSEDLGRATVIPLRDVQMISPINILDERGVLGVASDLVRCDARYRPLVNSLLGRTIVAENLGIAKKVLRRGLGNVVTRDGILLRPLGAISAGSARAIRRAFVHQREVGELPTDLGRLRERHDEATAALETAQRLRDEAKAEYEQLAPELERIRAELADAERALREHRARLPSTASRLSAQHARRHDAQRGLAQAQHAIEAFADEAERARAHALEQTAAHDRLRAEIDTEIESRETIAQSAAQYTSRVAALNKEREALDQQQSLQAAGVARVEQELSRRTELASSLDSELAAIAARLTVTSGEFDAKSREFDQDREELAPARHSLEQAESRQRGINDELAAARSKSMEAERALIEAEATVRLRSEEIDALRQRLEEEGFRPSGEGEIEPAVTPADDTGRPPAWLAAERRDGGDAPPPVRGGARTDPVALRERVTELRAEIRSLGPVNEQAGEDFAENRERHEFLSTQLKDLSDAEASLQEAIEELERIMRERFSSTFQKVNTEFQRYFTTFFGGGNAELLLTKTDEHGLPGVDIIAQPPRKKVRSIQLLSGGERSLTALALLFALLQTHPSPICVLDEVDAALDEANVDRFTAVLNELAERTQFIIVTHNRRTLEMADTIYGVSMGDDSTSTVLSLKLEEIPAA